jgi:hypothetical protein
MNEAIVYEDKMLNESYAKNPKINDYESICFFDDQDF